LENELLKHAGKSVGDGVVAAWKGLKWRLGRVAWLMYSHDPEGRPRRSLSWCLHRLASLRRRTLRRTLFVGITGSAGKTTTKDLLDRILDRGLGPGRKGKGTLNGPDDVARLLLATRSSDAYCVSEIAITKEAGLDLPLALFRPTVGIVTNVGGDHLSAYGDLDGIAREKSKLVASLPPDGIAVLNADDPRVAAMRPRSGRVMTYGTSDSAMLHGSAIHASWPDRLSLTVTWKYQTVRVQTQLCGSHWVPVVLAALAAGVALGVPLAVAAEAVASVEPFEGRMSPIHLDDGVTFIRDDWKAPLWTIAPTFEFIRQARARRKVIVVGTISDCPGDSSRRYAQIARHAMEVADCVLFVGNQASAALRAKRDAADMLFAFPALSEASAYLSGYLRPGDIVLLKGSTRTDHLERLILARTRNVECWRSSCGRIHFCDVCSLLGAPSSGQVVPRTQAIDVADVALRTPDVSAQGVPPVFVVGLGNPQDERRDTRHNVGVRAIELLAQRLGASWIREGDVADVCAAVLDGVPVRIVRPLAPMNDIGPAVLAVARAFGCTPNQCILVHDDLDLPLGSVRARNRGGDGGHRGVRSVLQSFQDDRFRRVKIGIGKPTTGESVADFVLQPFAPAELAGVEAAILAAADGLMEAIRQGSASRSTPKEAQGERRDRQMAQ
jgi:aminoacyl-tRNA hydrolase